MTDTIKTPAADASNMPALAPTPRAPKKAPAPKSNAKNAGTKKAPAAKSKPAPKSKPAATFTTVDLAAQHDINPKTLRARIRRNIDKWQPLFADGAKHVFKDNVTTRKAVAALLDA